MQKYRSQEISMMTATIMPTLRQARRLFEREYMASTVAATGGNLAAAARVADMERSAFFRKLRDLGLRVEKRIVDDDQETAAAPSKQPAGKATEKPTARRLVSSRPAVTSGAAAGRGSPIKETATPVFGFPLGD
jgi:hypothetical protein